MSIELLLLLLSTLILISIFSAVAFNNLGVPSLLLFIGVGMLAGSEGPGGVFFDDPGLTKSVGSAALVMILFSGGLDTHWSSVRLSVKPAAVLASAGVLLTAGLTGFFTWIILDLDIWTALLLGAIVSSTDAAAVFSVLRARSIDLKGRLKSMLELESGSNDPMAIFLTVALIDIITVPDFSVLSFMKLFFLQWALGSASGFLSGHLIVWVVNRLHSPYEGIYPVFMAASASFVYAGTALLDGSGFLAVYIAAIVIGNKDFVHKRSTLRFFDGIAWMSQITMFLTLGLLVYPSRIIPVIPEGLTISLFLIFAARPVSVFISLVWFNFSLREILFVSWVGLRGAVPVILALFPLLAGVSGADTIFNIVFFIVLTSALIQGWSIPAAARFLSVDKITQKAKSGLHEAMAMIEDSSKEITDIIVPFGSKAEGRSLVSLKIPEKSLIILINRGGEFIIPKGSTMLEGGDVILMLMDKNDEASVRNIFQGKTIGQKK